MEIKTEITNIKYSNLDHFINNRNDVKLEKSSNKIPVEKGYFNTKNNIFGLNHMENKSLSILQDIDSGKTVYRHIDKTTDSVITQFPRESELARIAFLNKIQKVALKKLVKEDKN